MLSHQVLGQVVKDFDLPATTPRTYEGVARALNALGFTHTNLRAEPRPEPFDIMFNPWNMKIIRGPYKGKGIQSINNLCYQDFFNSVKPYISPSCASMYHIRFVADLLRFQFPRTVAISIQGIGKIRIPTSNYHFDQNDAFAKTNFVKANRLYIKNFAEDMTVMRKIVEHVRDEYDEWIIDLGSGGRREEVAKILVAFFNPKDVPKDLYESRIRRLRTIWAPSDYTETDTTFGDYAFQSLRPKLPTYRGRIKIIIGGGVGSASYVFAAFTLLLGGKWKIIDDTYVLSRKSSRVQLVARSNYNRVSNRYNGEDGGHFTESGLKRPNVTWENPHRHLVGYFLVGHHRCV